MRTLLFNSARSSFLNVSRETIFWWEDESGSLLQKNRAQFHGPAYREMLYLHCVLKALNTIDNFLLSKTSLLNMYKITNMCKFELNRLCMLQETMKEKTPLSHEVVCFHLLDFETSTKIACVLKIKLVENYFFLEN